jgi:hypothetical protein
MLLQLETRSMIVFKRLNPLRPLGILLFTKKVYLSLSKKDYNSLGTCVLVNGCNNLAEDIIQNI